MICHLLSSCHHRWGNNVYIWFIGCIGCIVCICDGILQDIPATFQEHSNKGGLFTLFLHSPLQGRFTNFALVVLKNTFIKILSLAYVIHISLTHMIVHSTFTAFCFVTNIVDVPLHLWEKCLAYVQRFISEASRLLTRCRGVGGHHHHHAHVQDHHHVHAHDYHHVHIRDHCHHCQCTNADPSYLNFLADDFLRLLLCRYIFCDALLRIHR